MCSSPGSSRAVDMYPLNLNLRDRPVLVAGGGRVAERKVSGLLDAGADRLRVVSPELTPKLADLAAAGRIEWLARPFAPEDAAGCLLVFAATDSSEAQRQIRDAARKAGALANIADAPEDCDFQVPAAHRLGDILLTAATAGGSPLLAAAIRDEIARTIGPEYAKLARLMAALRAELRNHPLSAREKKMLFQKTLDSDIVRWLRDGEKGRVLAHLDALFGRLFPVGPLLAGLPDSPGTDTDETP